MVNQPTHEVHAALNQLVQPKQALEAKPTITSVLLAELGRKVAVVMERTMTLEEEAVLR